MQVLVDGRSVYSPHYSGGANWSTLPVALQDERFTSHEADSQLRDDSGVRDWRSRKQKLDAHAAQLILKDYFDVTA